MDWAKLLKDLRVECGVSQRRLAADARINRSTLSRIETGEAEAGVVDMERILDVLGYELDVMPRRVSVQSKAAH